ncbi:hypothetical protein Bpfe_000153 [Biomphalaria pfeifferi]|uniref:Uncharacterized protein n=1 Tax=Biomphalaria pfeifferi TaxID=112525 RepID=A0AAD8CE29_BIOPF|nr:hypothetical protein Bpfe_000153 [Biomphalaria pfeifferi]
MRSLCDAPVIVSSGEVRQLYTKTLTLKQSDRADLQGFPTKRSNLWGELGSSQMSDQLFSASPQPYVSQ